MAFHPDIRQPWKAMENSTQPHAQAEKPQRLLISITAILVTWILCSRLHSVFLGPLSKFPGPKFRAFTSLPKVITLVRGREQSDYVLLHRQYGPIVRIAPNELSFAGGAQAFKDIQGFKASGKPNFNKDDRFYGGDLFKPRTNCFIVNADDEEHSKLRRVVSHAFADKSLRDIEPMLMHWGQKFRERIDADIGRNSSSDMVKCFNCATFDIMGDLAFNEDLGMLRDGIESPWVRNVFEGIKYSTFMRGLKNCGTIGWRLMEMVLDLPAAQQGVRKTLNYTDKRLQRRLARDPDRPDLWSQIIAKGVGKHEIDQFEHRGLAFFFMVAGTETTASALSGTLFYLLTNDGYMKKLQAELREAFSSVADVNLNTLARLPYLDAVLREGLRMYPPVPISLPRKSPAQGAMVDGVFIPGGVTCGIHHMSTYRQTRLFTDPDEYRPERWLGDEKYRTDRLDAVEPFHIGPRNCVGKNLAWHEMRLLLGTLLQQYDVKLEDACRDWMTRNKVYTVWQKPELMCEIKRAAI